LNNPANLGFVYKQINILPLKSGVIQNPLYTINRLGDKILSGGAGREENCGSQ